jgi:CDP-diacylglycerol--serine O-phosphatidyltransferase
MKNSEWGWTASLLTTGNLFFGFWAIVQIFEGNVLMASWLILFAAICDGLDGKLARFTKSCSEIGIEFDSLADAVSFGAAPALLLYSVSFYKLGFGGLLLASLPLIFGVYRLARFNKSATKEEKKNYDGLPIPISATTLSMFVVFNYAVWGDFRLELLLIPLTVGLAALMISHVRYDAMPRFTFRETGKNFLRFVAIIVAAILIAFNPPVIFFPLLMIYVLKGLMFAIFPRSQEDEEIEDLEEVLWK